VSQQHKWQGHGQSPKGSMHKMVSVYWKRRSGKTGDRCRYGKL